MKNICIVTTTRAEYGLLRPLILALKEEKFCDIKIAVTGAHLSTEFGLTYKEIVNDGIKIDKQIDILLGSDSSSAVSKTMALALISFSDYFESILPDALIILGDRYEALAVATAAMNHRIPIIHLHGGEITQGAIDDAIRHSITKMSSIHFVSTETYRKRVIQLGENPRRVFNVGSLGVENIKKMEYMSRNELEENIGFPLSNLYAIVTFHPVTLEDETASEQIDELLKAISKIDSMSFIFTMANADHGGRIINHKIKSFVSKNENCIFFESLGVKRYLSAIKYCSMVIGNSSSGIIEVPSFKKPTINIGSRQKGRIQAKSIINCEPKCNQIIKAIQKANDPKFRKSLDDLYNPYEKNGTVDNIVSITRELLEKDEVIIDKKFYDVLFNIE